MRVLLAGGGTAGHTSPLLATAAALQERQPGVVITCLGTATGLEATLIPQAGYRLELVPAVPLPRKISFDLLKLPFRLWSALRHTAQAFDLVAPDVVVGFGGYVSVPAYVVARKRGIPIVVHEGNALPGLANRLGALFTKNVVTSFPNTELRHGRYLGLPIRKSITSLNRRSARKQAREFFGLKADAPTVLVTGGSQGARSINRAMSEAAPILSKAGVQVLHSAGRVEEVIVDSGDVPYIVKPFIDRIDLAYAAADLIVCRAGANSVLETASVGLPGVYVPLPIGNGEQARNADALVTAGGAIVIDDEAFTSRWVAQVLIALVKDETRLDAMSRAAQGLVPRDGDVALAAVIEQAADQQGVTHED